MFKLAQLKALDVSRLLEINDNTSILYQLLHEEAGYKTLKTLFLDQAFFKQVVQHKLFLTSFLKTLNKNTSVLSLLSNTDIGYEILEQLMADEPFKIRLLQHPSFIPALLKLIENGIDNHASVSFWLIGYNNRRPMLQELLADESFKTRLLQDAAFIPALLKTIEMGEYKHISALYWLAVTEDGCLILQQLFADELFKIRMLRDRGFIPAFLTIIECDEGGDTSVLFRLSGIDNGRQLLQQLFADERFRANVLQDVAFIPALLKIIETEINQNTSALYWLTATENGCQLLQQLLADEPFKTRLLRNPAFIPTLLKIVENGRFKNTSALFWLSGIQVGRQLLQQLLADEPFKKRFLQDHSFIPTLLNIIETGQFKNNSALQRLAVESGDHILQQLLAYEPLRTGLLQDGAFIPTLLTIIEIGEYKKHTSALYWFSSIESGCQMLLQLLADEHSRTRLLQHAAFIPALLTIIEIWEYKDTSALFRLSGLESGRQILQQLLADEFFKTRLLHDPAFMPALLKIIEIGGYKKYTSALYWFSGIESGREILWQLLSDERFKTRLLRSAAFIRALVTIIERGEGKNTSALFLLSNNKMGCQILHQLLVDERFRVGLLRDVAFIPALLKTVDGELNKNTSTLFWLTLDTLGLLILKEIFKHPGLIERLSQHENFSNAFFSGMLQSVSVFFNILNVPECMDIIQTLMQSPHFRANVWQCFGIDACDENLSWVYQSMAGFTLFKLLLEEKQQNLLRIPLKDLLEHPLIQLYVRQGALDPNLFLLISATDAGDVLQHRQCSP